MPRNEQSSKRRHDRNEKERQSSRALQRQDERTEQPARIASPFSFMRRFSEEMDRLFEDFGLGEGLIAPTFERGLDQLGALGRGAWAPQVEVFERKNELVIRTDLPGMKKDDVQIDIDENSLVIQGERTSEHEEDEEGYYRTERSYGKFYRRIPLPKGVDPDEASADFRDGVLEIIMPAPKEVAEKRRRLEIGGEHETQPRSKAKAAAR